MKYNIFSQTEPEAPMQGKGLESIRVILSEVSKEMQNSLLPMLFPILGAQTSGLKFQYPDNSWKELSGMISILIADSGGGKGQLAYIVESMCKRMREHDKKEMEALIEWQQQVKTKGANKEKPARPNVAFLMPPVDMTAPALIQNAIALESHGDLTQYLNLPEIEMADRICGGHKAVSQMIRNIFDNARCGTLRASADGITGNPVMRMNMTLSCTPVAAVDFFKGKDMENGTFGRVACSYKPSEGFTQAIPRLGKFDSNYDGLLSRMSEKVEREKGNLRIAALNKLVDELASEISDICLQADDKNLHHLSHRSLVMAWKAGCILWLLADKVWTKAMSEMVTWLFYHDLWSKLQVFGSEMVSSKSVDRKVPGPRNMLEELPENFDEPTLIALRLQMGRNAEGSNSQLRTWVHRGLLSYDEKTHRYTKTNGQK